MARKLAILIFDEVEVLDFAGPFEVFAVARHHETGEPLFEVYTVAQKPTIRARNGLSVNATYTLDDCPTPDIFLVPGGQGVRQEITNPRVIDWIRSQASHAEQTLSVCTGAWLLGAAGVLAGLSATTYHTGFERLQEIEPTVSLQRGARWVDNGRVVTSAGVSAGIDMALYIIEKLFSPRQAQATADYMEYEYYRPVRGG